MEYLASRPNLFKIVARTHTETWHSMFLGWLLDPSGSHGLKDFSLKRLLVALANPILQEDDTSKISTNSKIALLGDLTNASVTPNETNQTEWSTEDGSKLDVFISGITCEDENDTVILIEQKVHAPIDKKQCKKYADWLYNKYPNENKILLMLAPSDRLGTSIEDTIGDNRWNAIDYQTLHDKILVPIIKSPDLSRITLPLIDQYIDALRVPSDERKLAVTEEEKELARELYDKHKAAFKSIAAALRDTGEIDELLGYDNNKAPLNISIENTTIEGQSVRDLYKNTLKYLIDNNVITDENVPYETSSKRYLISKQPKHQQDNPFKVPVEYNGFFMEANKSRASGIKDLMRFLKHINCVATTTSNK